MSLQLTYRFRLKDKHAAELRRQSRAVNLVWNHCQEAQRNALRWGKRWPTGYDLQKLCAGSSKELGLLSSSIDRVCEQYAKSRKEAKRATLRWRGKKSLGWIPLKDGAVRFDGVGFIYRGRRLDAWVTRDLKPGQTFACGSISQDARGRWYINLPVKCAQLAAHGRDAIGIDLGLKELATLSTGKKIEHPRWYQRTQTRLAAAQRAGKLRQASRLHAAAAAQRSDYLHKQSTALVREHGAIFVGNVRPSAIAKTRMSKSSLDAGWAMFKQQLAYKAIRHGVLFAEVNEAYSTQTCSRCGSVEGPKGVAGLGIRGWTCSCGAVHDRDTNAAMNILARGLASLAEGAAPLCSGVANLYRSNH